MAHVAEYKKKKVKEMVDLSKQYPIVGVVNMENLPAQQLQAMRSELREKVHLFMTKKTLMRLALEKIKVDKKGVEELEKQFDGMPALIFTKDSPFKLSRILKKSKTPAPAKAGQTAPYDIIIPAGPTPFAPGPVISELSSAGLNVGVEGGKVAVKEDSTVAKRGEKISQKVAEVLTRLDIKPMEVGLDLVAAYEDGIIYHKDILEVDEKEYENNVNLAAVQAFNLAFNTTYVTNDNASLLIGKAFNDAKAIGLEQGIIDSGIIDELLAKAERSMLGLQSTADIQVEEKPKTEVKEEKAETEVKETPSEKPAEPKKEEPKPEEKKPEPEPKPEPKPEPVETPKPEPKKEAPKQEQPQEKPEVKKEEPTKPTQPEIKEPLPEKVDEKKPEVQTQTEQKPETPKPQEQQLVQEKSEIKIPKPEVKQEAPKVEEKPKQDIDKKVDQMVEQTKKFAKGEEDSAQDILEEVKKEEQVPSAHDLVEETKPESEEDKKKKKEEEDQKKVEDLAKELVKKGTLRK